MADPNILLLLEADAEQGILLLFLIEWLCTKVIILETRATRNPIPYERFSCVYKEVGSRVNSCPVILPEMCGERRFSTKTIQSLHLYTCVKKSQDFRLGLLMWFLNGGEAYNSVNRFLTLIFGLCW
jgi:hypothetical protein